MANCKPYKTKYCFRSLLIMVYPFDPANLTGMRKFRIDQDFLIEHWHMIYVMSVVFAVIYV